LADSSQLIDGADPVRPGFITRISPATIRHDNPGAAIVNTETANAIGVLAGTLTTISFVPQVVKIWKSKHARDISLGMFVIFSSGVLLWLFYGIETGAMPVVVANAVTLGLSLTILAFKIRYR
jgi:MtN3 and saliva related transmembrane protein